MGKKLFLMLFGALVFACGITSESRAEPGNQYFYDEQGRLMKAWRSPDWYYYTYDSNGNIASDGSNYYTYDSNGNQTSSRSCNQVAADGSCAQYYQGRTDYTYDANGNMTSERYCNQVAADGSCASYSGGNDYTYDSNGNKTSSRQCSRVAADGSCSSYSGGNDYTYDSNGNQTSYRYCNPVAADGSCSSYSGGNDYTYDSNGNKTSSRQCSRVAADGSCAQYSNSNAYDYTYDSNGNMTSEKRCNQVAADGSCAQYYQGRIDYTYDYDEFGNIINKYANGELVETREYSDGYYVKLEDECNDAGNCKACSKWSSLDGTKCVPGYEWIDDETLVISDDLPEFTLDVMGLSSGMPEKILCRGDVTKCKEKLRSYPIYFGGGNSYGFGSGGDPYGYSAPSGGEYLGVDLGDYVEPATEANCETGRYYWSGSSCNNKSGGINCEENFKQIETWCNRIRYTPADAAKVLKDTDNEIVMTFKVNR